jgi:hypothetical protein
MVVEDILFVQFNVIHLTLCLGPISKVSGLFPIILTVENAPGQVDHLQ